VAVYKLGTPSRCAASVCVCVCVSEQDISCLRAHPPLVILNVIPRPTLRNSVYIYMYTRPPSIRRILVIYFNDPTATYRPSDLIIIIIIIIIYTNSKYDDDDVHCCCRWFLIPLTEMRFIYIVSVCVRVILFGRREHFFFNIQTHRAIFLRYSLYILCTAPLHPSCSRCTLPIQL